MIQLERKFAEIDADKAAIRQIAILLHTLPERTHRVLLGQLDGDEKQYIADELLSLGEVDAMEQYRVLNLLRDRLQAETQSVEKVESEIQDEIQIGRARVSKKRSNSIYRASESASENAGEPAILSQSTLENPVSTATIQSSESTVPATAECTSQTQSDVVTGQAGMTPTPEVLQLMFTQFHQTQAAGVLPVAAMQRGSSMQDKASRDAPRPSNHERNDRPHVLPINGSNDGSINSVEASDEAEIEAGELARRVDQFLTQLPPAELCRCLGMVTTKQAFLVLCGLPNETAETVLEMLPRRQSRKVRSDMRRMGQLQLSDIDAAKQVVTEIAIRMTTQPTSFAA